MKLRDLNNIFENQNVYIYKMQKLIGLPYPTKPRFGLIQYADDESQDAEVLAVIHGSLLDREGSHAGVYTILIDR